MRIFLIGCVALTLVSAFTLYAINYDTRQIETAVNAKQRAIEAARKDIAVLKAERAHLARPERIAPLARGLGLEPVRKDQFGTPLTVGLRGAGARQ